MTNFARKSLPAIAAIAAIGLVAMPGTANAWWRGGGGFGIAILPPPVVFAPPPPVYYAPPPVYYAPPPAYAPAYAAPAYASPAPSGQGCYAGAYVCPLEHATPVGANCSCPTNSGRIAGQVN